MKNSKISYWLIKSEPDVWSIDQQIKSGAKGAIWDGVRNYQAANNLKKMQKGDLCFFYHPHTKGSFSKIFLYFYTIFFFTKIIYIIHNMLFS